MKVLLDACLSPEAKSQLEAAGHDVVWAGDWREDPGDTAILSQAYQQERVLVTLDKDFGELGVLREARHCGIVRLVIFGRLNRVGRACRFWPATPTTFGKGPSLPPSPDGCGFAMALAGAGSLTGAVAS